MKITSEPMYTVVLTGDEWETIDSLIRNIKVAHLYDMGCTNEVAANLWEKLLKMREELHGGSL